MTDQGGWASVDKARLMGLDYAPTTPVGMAFCDALGASLTSLEKRHYQRQGKRKHAFNRAAGAIAADLLKAGQLDRERWSYRVLTTSTFTGALVSYVDFKSVLAAAEAGNLIEKYPGHYQRYDYVAGVNVGAGRATRFRPLPELIALAAKWELNPENVDDHFERLVPPLPPKPLLLRGSSTRLGHRKFKGNSLPFEHTAQTDRLEQDVRDLNEFLSRHDIGGGIHRGYRRIFNEGDKTPYSWNKGGRLYSVGEDSYQSLKKGQRLKMMLDDEPVAEIDIRASYLTLLHGLWGMPFSAAERDPYHVPHLPRAVVKAWVNMTIGHNKFHGRWPRGIAEDLRESGDESINTGKYPMREITPIILAALPILKDWPQQPLSGFDLMYGESEAVIGTMLELMRKHGVPSLSVHDSIIVPIRKAADACDILKRRYKEVSNIIPHLETRAEPHLGAWF